MTRKTTFYEGWYWFRFNNLGLALIMVLEFYCSMAKRLKLKVRKFWGQIPTFEEVTGENLNNCACQYFSLSHKIMSTWWSFLSILIWAINFIINSVISSFTMLNNMIELKTQVSLIFWSLSWDHLHNIKIWSQERDQNISKTCVFIFHYSIQHGEASGYAFYSNHFVQKLSLLTVLACSQIY